MSWALVLHGGAGDWREDGIPAALAGIRRAAERGRALCEQGASALEVVCEAVALLEDDPVFNAGTGSVLNRDGEAEMDAAVMRGRDLAFGAVGAITRVRHPVHVARAVMERSAHALLVGTGALAFAREHGFGDHDPVSERARADHLARMHPQPPGTVGAACLDAHGELAAATSTGGLFLKLPGRVGDSPLPGAGTYAGSAAAVSATGKGELVMRVLGAKRIHDLIGSGARAQPAIQQMLREMRANVGADAGFIAVSRAGDIGIAHGTPAMVHAWCRDGEPGIQAGWKV